MEVRFVSENRACEWIDYLTDEEGRYKTIGVVASSFSTTRRVIKDLGLNNYSTMMTDDDYRASRNGIEVIAKSIGKCNIEDFKNSFNCLVVIPDNIPFDLIAKLVSEGAVHAS